MRLKDLMQSPGFKMYCDLEQECAQAWARGEEKGLAFDELKKTSEGRIPTIENVFLVIQIKEKKSAGEDEFLELEEIWVLADSMENILVRAEHVDGIFPLTMEVSLGDGYFGVQGKKWVYVDEEKMDLAAWIQAGFEVLGHSRASSVRQQLEQVKSAFKKEGPWWIKEDWRKNGYDEEILSKIQELHWCPGSGYGLHWTDDVYLWLRRRAVMKALDMQSWVEVEEMCGKSFDELHSLVFELKSTHE